MSSLDVNLVEPRWCWDRNGRRKDAVCTSTPLKKGEIFLKFMFPSNGNLSCLWGCYHQVQQGLTCVLSFLLHISLTELVIWRAGIVTDSGKHIHDELQLQQCSAVPKSFSNLLWNSCCPLFSGVHWTSLENSPKYETFDWEGKIKVMVEESWKAVCWRDELQRRLGREGEY